MNEQPGVTLDQLLAYALGNLQSHEAAEVRAQLERSPAAREDYQSVLDSLETLRHEGADVPTAAIVQRLLQTFRDNAGALFSSWLQNAERVRSQVVFDSWLRAARAGVRGGSDKRVLAYEHDRARIDLRIAPDTTAAAAWIVQGQLRFHADDVANLVALTPVDAAPPIATQRPDDQGTFALRATDGAYDLVVIVDDGATAIIAPRLVLESGAVS